MSRKLRLNRGGAAPKPFGKVVNMKRTAIIALILAALPLCGCDFLRGLAGRPVSADINGRRAAIALAEKEREQARADSLRAAEKIVGDSLAALSRIDSLGIAVISLSNLGGSESVMSAGYAVVVGSFRSASNAAGMAGKVSRAGYPSEVLAFGNGMSSVIVEPCGRLSDAVVAYMKVRNEKFCPKDAWILKNDASLPGIKSGKNE